MASASETQLSIVLKLIDDASNELKAAQTAFKQFGDTAAESVQSASASMEGSFNAVEQEAIQSAERALNAWTTSSQEIATATADSFDEMATTAQYAAATAKQSFATEEESIAELNAMIAQAETEVGGLADATDRVTASGGRYNRTFGQAIHITAEYYGAFLLLNSAITAFEDAFDTAIGDALTQSPQLADEWQDIQDKWNAAEQTLGTELMPVIEAFFSVIEAAMPAVLAGFDAFAAILNVVALPFKILIDDAQALGYFLGGNFTEAAYKADQASDAVGDTISNVAQDFTNAGKDITTGFDGMASATTQDLNKVSSTAQAAAASVTQSIEQIQQQMSDQQDTLTGNLGDAQSQEATAIVAEQQKIADLKTQIAQSSDAQTTANLQAELAKEQAAYDKYAQLRQDLSTQVTQAEQTANETDFEQQIQKIQNTEVQEVNAFSNQMTRLQQEMDEETAKAANAQANEKDITATVDTETQKQTQLVTTQVNAQIAEYNQLRAAASSAFGGSLGGSVLPLGAFSVSTPAVTSVHDAIITPSGIVQTDPADYIFATKDPGSLAGGGGITINVTGNTISNQLDIRNIAQAVSAEIVRILRINQKVSI